MMTKKKSVAAANKTSQLSPKVLMAVGIPFPPDSAEQSSAENQWNTLDIISSTLLHSDASPPICLTYLPVKFFLRQGYCTPNKRQAKRWVKGAKKWATLLVHSMMMLYNPSQKTHCCKWGNNHEMSDSPPHALIMLQDAHCFRWGNNQVMTTLPSPSQSLGINATWPVATDSLF